MTPSPASPAATAATDGPLPADVLGVAAAFRQDPTLVGRLPSSVKRDLLRALAMERATELAEAGNGLIPNPVCQWLLEACRPAAQSEATARQLAMPRAWPTADGRPESALSEEFVGQCANRDTVAMWPEPRVLTALVEVARTLHATRMVLVDQRYGAERVQQVLLASCAASHARQVQEEPFARLGRVVAARHDELQARLDGDPVTSLTLPVTMLELFFDETTRALAQEVAVTSASTANALVRADAAAAQLLAYLRDLLPVLLPHADARTLVAAVRATSPHHQVALLAAMVADALGQPAGDQDYGTLLPVYEAFEADDPWTTTDRVRAALVDALRQALGLPPVATQAGVDKADGGLPPDAVAGGFA